MLLCTRAIAADLTVDVRSPGGEPVRDAVVTVYPASGAGGQAAHFPWALEMAQQNLQFDPFVLVVPVGGDVSFPNRDGVRHHVYSFSPARRFELKLYGKGETPSVKFDKPGVVALGCNIHDSMVAFIDVVDTPFAAKTSASGQAELHGLPAGPVVITVWHPYLRAPANQMTRAIDMPAAGLREAFVGELRPPPAPMRH
jgi:plastocyanin